MKGGTSGELSSGAMHGGEQFMAAQLNQAVPTTI
jgi:hypothetical protein